MNHIDYPVFKQFLDEFEHYSTILKKIEEVVENKQRDFSLNVTELEFDYKNNTVNIINVLMGLKKHDPKSFCQLSINEFLDILIEKNSKKGKQNNRIE